EYLRRVEDLRDRLTQAGAYLTHGSRFAASLARDEPIAGAVFPDNPRVYAGEPYRRKLSFMLHRLQRRSATIERRIAGETLSDPADGYAVAAEFLEDLEALHDDLIANRAARIANGGLKDLIILARSFGFHLATLDIRQEAARHHAAVAELIGALPG